MGRGALHPCLTAAVMLAPLAAAPPAAAKDDSDIILVTPLAQPSVNLQNFPHPVQTLSGRDISRDGAANAIQALAQQAAGVNLTNSQANPYQPTVLYHGFEISPIQGTPAGLSVYIDGARFNTAFGDLAIWSLLPDEAINALSIESGNPAFGLNALGGAINVQMKNGFNNQGGQALLSGGSFGTVQGNIEYGKQAGNQAVYVDLGGLRAAGWRDEQSSNVENFYGDFGWRGARARLHINLTYAHSDLDGPGTVPVQLLEADPAAQFTGPNNITDGYFKLAANLHDRLTAQTSLQAVAYYDYLHEVLTNGNGPDDLPCGNGAYLCQSGGTGAPSTARGGTLIPNFLPVPDAYGYYAYSQLDMNTTNTNAYGASLQFTNTAALRGFANKVSAGLSYDGGFTAYAAEAYLGGIDAARNYVPPPGGPYPGFELDEPGTVPVGVDIRNDYYGIFASDTLNLTSKLSVTGTFRFNLADINLDDQDAPDPNAPGAGLNGRHDYRHFNPALGAAYDITPNFMVYGGYSEQNAVPTPAELSCASPEDSCSLANFMAGDPALKQIIARSWQAGWRGIAAGPGGSLITYNGDVYLTKTDDEIAFLQSPYNPAGQGYFGNIGAVRRVGFDLAADVSLLKWDIYADYSWIDASYQDGFIEASNSPEADRNGNITVHPGDQLPGIPHNIIKIGATFHATPRWTFGTTLTAQTSSYLHGDEANLTKPLPGYAVLDITASYLVTPALRIFAAIDNATDARYYTYGAFSPTGADGGVYLAEAPDYTNPRSYAIAAPIGVYAGVKYKF